MGVKPTLRQLADKVKRWLDKLAQEAETVDKAMEKVAVAYLRSKMIPEVKNYLDLTEANTMPRYLMKIEEWERSNPHKKNLYRLEGVQGANSQYRQGTQGSLQSGVKRSVTCFHCGKRKQGSMKRIEIPVDCVKALGENEVMGHINGVLLPITLDSGAQISLVPVELVQDDQFTGRNTTFKTVLQSQSRTGRLAEVTLQIGGETYTRTAVTVPGEDIAWTVATSCKMTDTQEQPRLVQQLIMTSQLPEEDTHFLPLRMEEGVVKGAVRVSQGTVVEAKTKPVIAAVADTGVVGPKPHCEEAKVTEECAEVEEADAGSVTEKRFRESFHLGIGR